MSGERDPLWQNVWAYIGPIRDYDPVDWTHLRREDLYEFHIEVVVGDQVVSYRYVEDREEIRAFGVEQLVRYRLDQMVEVLDWRLEKFRKEQPYGGLDV